MATDRGRWGPLALVAATFASLALPPPAAAAAEPWWVPIALRSQDNPRAAALLRDACVRDHCAASRPGGRTVSISAGRVIETGPASAPATLPGSPDLGPGATLIAAPAALPEALIAVDAGGTIRRRAPDGSWGRSLVLLPGGLLTGTPAVTSVAAFDRPLSPAVYVATDGYSVLISNDGGESWIRAGAELPDRVFALAADSSTGSIYAATSDGLWVHHVRRLPSAPSYAGDTLWWRWLGVIAVALTASAAALAGLYRALAPR